MAKPVAFVKKNAEGRAAQMQATEIIEKIESAVKAYSETQLGKTFAATKAIAIGRQGATLTIYKNQRSKPESVTVQGTSGTKRTSTCV